MSTIVELKIQSGSSIVKRKKSKNKNWTFTTQKFIVPPNFVIWEAFLGVEKIASAAILQALARVNVQIFENNIA